jgi:hypothetical protein
VSKIDFVYNILRLILILIHSSKSELNIEIFNGIDLLEKILTLTETPRIILENVIPSGLLNQNDYLLTIVNSS